MSLFMVSLAGVPPTAGFMAKLTVFRSAIEADLVPLAVFGVITSVAGLYSSLRPGVYLDMSPRAKPGAVEGGRRLSAGPPRPWAGRAVPSEGRHARRVPGLADGA